MDADETWDGSRTSRVFAAGMAVGSVLGLVLGSAIGIVVGERTARGLRHLIVELLRRADRVDFEVLAQ